MSTPEIAEGLLSWILLCIAVALHEWGHAAMTDRLGDMTPRSQGRVTLNPLAHLDAIGTGLIPLFNIFLGGGFAMIGWGKPVQFNPGAFHPKERMKCVLLCVAAGPAMNAVQALAGSLILALGLAASNEMIVDLGAHVIYLNVALIVFNLLPIPPLDGSHFARYLFGLSEELYQQMASYGFIVLLLLINLPPFRMFMGVLIGIGVTPFMGLAHLLALPFGG